MKVAATGWQFTQRVRHVDQVLGYQVAYLAAAVVIVLPHAIDDQQVALRMGAICAAVRSFIVDSCSRNNRKSPHREVTLCLSCRR